MTADGVALLWLCGASGVGKSSVAWEIFAQLSRAGIKSAYLDADQLGLCYPAPAGDPDNHRVKARNLGEVWPTFRDAGVGCIVVSGGVTSIDSYHSYIDGLPGAVPTLCRLGVGPDELRDRIRKRAWLVHLADEAVAEGEALDRDDFADLSVDTTGLPVADVARLVRQRAGDWPGHIDGGAARPAQPARRDKAADPDASDPPARAPVLWLCGTSAVGKSTVGYEIFTRVRTDGVKAAYVDLSQISFCRPARDDDPHNHRLKAANLGAMWPTFRAAGARCLVVSGVVEDAAVIASYLDALPGTVLTLCRLHAGRETLTERILLRGQGRGPAILGDELRGQSRDYLDRFAEQAASAAAELDRAGVGDLSVVTDGRSAEDVAEAVRAQAGGWPGLR